MANGTRKESAQSAYEILAKFDSLSVAEVVNPDQTAAAIVAVGHALLAINTQLARLVNEVSSAKMAIQAVAAKR